MSALSPPLITGRAFYEALVAAGVLRSGERIRRVTISINALDEAPLIEVERAGDERLLEVASLLTGVPVTDAADGDV